MTLLAVALGGGIGALARYGMEAVIAQRQSSAFPLSTLVVNVLGSIAVGVVAGASAAGLIGETIISGVETGFLGAFTTFSSFTYETLQLIDDGAWRYAIWNIALSGPVSFIGAEATFLAMKHYL